jgi:hypothetical protein
LEKDKKEVDAERSDDNFKKLKLNTINESLSGEGYD